MKTQDSQDVTTVKLSSAHRNEGGKVRVISHQCFHYDKLGCTFEDVPYGSTISGDDFVRFIDLEPLWNPTIKAEDAKNKSNLAARYIASSTTVTSNPQTRKGPVEHHDCPECSDLCKHGMDDPHYYICPPGCRLCQHDKKRGLDEAPHIHNEEVEGIPRSSPSSVDDPDVGDEIDHRVQLPVSAGIEQRNDDVCRPCRVWCASSYLELIDSGIDWSQQEMYCPPLCFTCSLFGDKAKRDEETSKPASVDDPEVADEIENPVSLALSRRQLPGTPALHRDPYAQQQYMLAANETHSDDNIQGQSIGMQIAMVCVGALIAMGLFLAITQVWTCCRDGRGTRREMREMLP